MTGPESPTARPCRFCVAVWTGWSNRPERAGDMPPTLPEPDDCEFEHRDDPRVYALGEAMAFQGTRTPTDEQIGWFLADANDVVDDFDPPPERWRVRKLPESANDHEQGIEVRLRINDVTYVALEGGKECRGSVMRLSTFREVSGERT